MDYEYEYSRVILLTLASHEARLAAAVQMNHGVFAVGF